LNPLAQGNCNCMANTIKNKLSDDDLFFKVNKRISKTVGRDEAILLAYVSEFEAQGLSCFASRAHISAELGMSESTVRRVIKTLVDLGYLEISYRGMKRTLKTVPNLGQNDRLSGSNWTSGGVKLNQQPGSKRTNTKIHIQRSNYKDKLQREQPEPNLERINEAARKFGLKKRF